MIAAESYCHLRPEGEPGLLFVCDHASNRLPVASGGLGLEPEALDRHIAYDIGAADLARALSERLGAPAVLAGFSRLLIDVNRGVDDPTLIMALSDGAVVRGNHPLSPAERDRRIAQYYRPYHDAITAAVDRALALGVVPALFSIHSFTPVWKGVPRPWHLGVLWNKDGRLAKPLLEALRCEGDITVGDNEPYSGELEGDTMDRHGTQRGLPHVLIEIRQDLIDNERKALAWAERLAPILVRLVNRLRLAKEKGVQP